MLFILIGYTFGIISKLLTGIITYVFWFYILNFVMVAIDVTLFLKNSKIDKRKN